MAIPCAISGLSGETLSDDGGGQLADQLQAVDWDCAWLTALAARSRQWQQALQLGAPAWRSEMNAQARAMQLATEARPADSNGAPALQSSPLHFIKQDELPVGTAYAVQSRPGPICMISSTPLSGFCFLPSKPP